LVAAIETLSQRFLERVRSWESFHDAATWDRWIADADLNGITADALRHRILAMGPIRIKQTFVDYVVDRLDSSFWGQSVFGLVLQYEMTSVGTRLTNEYTWTRQGLIDELVPSDPDELRQRLRKTYDARSRIVHESARLSSLSVLPMPSTSELPLGFLALR
jgi:hypothetical protein